MAGLPIGQNDDAGAELSQNPHDLDAVFQGVFNRTVGQIERLTPADAQQASCFSSLAGTIFRAAAGSSLALSQVKDGGAEAARSHAEQGSSTCLLDIVAMCRNSQNIGHE